MTVEVAFDLDGVLCDNAQRIHDFVATQDRAALRLQETWLPFNEGLLDDPPNEGWVQMLKALVRLRSYVYIVTSRPESCREATVKWLEAHKLPYTQLVMRPDHAPWDTWKPDYLVGLHAHWPLDLVIDDSIYVCQELERRGVPVLYVQHGCKVDVRDYE